MAEIYGNIEHVSVQCSLSVHRSHKFDRCRHVFGQAAAAVAGPCSKHSVAVLRQRLVVPACDPSLEPVQPVEPSTSINYKSQCGNKGSKGKSDVKIELTC